MKTEMRHTNLHRQNGNKENCITKRGARVAAAVVLIAATTVVPQHQLIATDNTPAKPCVVIIDDVSSPSELKQHGIEPADPDTLMHIFDVIAGKNIACALIYMPVREQASRGIPVVIEMAAFNEEPPPVPDRGLPLRDLHIAWVGYRKAKLAYDDQLQQFETAREETRAKFVRKALDALASAEAEVSALRRRHGKYRASDIEGTLLSAVATAKTMQAAGVLLVLNSDLVDDPGHRRSRSTPLTEDELPPALIRGLVLVNTSYKPDGAPLLARTPIAKHHAQSLKAAAELVANLLSSIK